MNRIDIARDLYRAYETGVPDALQRHLADDFQFFSPADPGIDRARYFERCWPNAQRTASFAFVRMLEAGDEVIVTYKATTVTGTRFCNTEILTFRGDAVVRVEVFFGWALP